jgi:hypothetical protein
VNIAFVSFPAFRCCFTILLRWLLFSGSREAQSPTSANEIRCAVALLKQMTTAEKIGQLKQLFYAKLSDYARAGYRVLTSSTSDICSRASPINTRAYFGTNPQLAELLRSQTSVDECIDLYAPTVNSFGY